MAIAEDGAHRNESSMNAPLKPLNRQAMVIPGASSGTGLATTRSNARQGSQLVLAARSADTWEKVVTALSEQGAQHHSVKADVGDWGDVETSQAKRPRS
jgi:NADP-dependent 3-hydroxy acid dehydrogenase YdfG